MLSAERIALLKHGAPPRNALEAALRNVWYGGGGASYEKTVGPAPIISISDAKAKPAKSLIVGMEPIQDLHGYDSPWPAGGGKQLLDPSTFEAETTAAGVTATLNSDGTISLSGTATATAYITIIGYKLLSDYGIFTADTTYKVSGFANSNCYVGFGIRGSGTDYWASTAAGRDISFTAEQLATKEYRLIILVNNGTNTNGITIKPMICLASASNPATFAPYSNICPISGRTGVTVERTGKNLLDPAERQNIGTSNIHFYFTAGLLLKAGQAYTFSVSTPAAQLTFLAMDGTTLAIVYSTTKKTYTPSEDVLVKFDAYFSGQYPAPSGGLSEVNCQLEIGSTASAYEPYVGASYPVVFPDAVGTVYGGTVDVVSGVLTVDRAMVDLGTLTWTMVGSYAINRFDAVVPGMTASKTAPYSDGIFCSAYNPSNVPITQVNVDATIARYSGRVFVCDSAYSDAASFKSGVSGVQLCYELATPQTYQLTPTQIALLKNENVLWSDADDLTLTYLGTTPANLLGGMLGGGLGNQQEPTEETSEEPTEGDGE